MTVSLVGLFALAALGALVFLIVLGLTTLLTNPKTRDAAKILLGGLAALVLMIVLVGGLFVGVAKTRVVPREVMTAVEIPAASLPQHTVGSDEAATHTSTPNSDNSENTETSEAKTAGEKVGTTETDSSPLNGGEAVPSGTEPAAEESTEEATTTEEEADESNVGELSVAPLSDVDRPAWVDREPHKEGSVYYWPVAADPRPDVTEAEEEALPEALDAAVAKYIATKMKLGSAAARHVRLAPDYLRNELVGEDIWIEPHSLSMGEFVCAHALIKFDRKANMIIEEQWDQQKVVIRLWSATGILFLVLFFLALIYCYLKIDQVTQGSRRGLLRFAAILVILGLILVAAGVASVVA